MCVYGLYYCNVTNSKMSPWTRYKISGNEIMTLHTLRPSSQNVLHNMLHASCFEFSTCDLCLCPWSSVMCHCLWYRNILHINWANLCASVSVPLVFHHRKLTVHFLLFRMVNNVEEVGPSCLCNLLFHMLLQKFMYIWA